MYVNKTQTINDSISSAYEVDIYHYECQEGGYYQVYTKGSTDTVGAIYEEQNSLLSNPTYKRRASNDVGKITSKDNFSMVVGVDRWEDYYVCVRGYYNNKGSYSLKIEPNQDKTWYRNYGVWKKKYSSDLAAGTGVWTNRKIYLTKEQALACYLTLDGWDFIYNGNVYPINEVRKLYQANIDLAINVVWTTVSSVLGCYKNAVGITASVLGLIFLEILGTTGNFNVDLKSKLEKLCGIKKKAKSEITANGIEGSITISYGIKMKEVYTGTPGRMYIYEFDKYAGTTGAALRGEKWYYGEWTY